MKRTTIFLPEMLERELQLYARRAGRPAAAVVREALHTYLARQAAPGLPSFAAEFDSGRSDTADRHEDVLFADLAAHEPSTRPKRVRQRAPARRGRRGRR